MPRGRWRSWARHWPVILGKRREKLSPTFGVDWASCCSAATLQFLGTGTQPYPELILMVSYNPTTLYLNNDHCVEKLKYISTHLIQCSKEENWFYKRFQQTFHKSRINYFVVYFQVPLTGARLGLKIDRDYKLLYLPCDLFVSSRLVWQGTRSWFIHKIYKICK